MDPYIYGGDNSDAFKHLPRPFVPTFVSIDDRFTYWYIYRCGNDVEMEKVFPVMRFLHGHTESGRLWESQIHQILNMMGFTTTTHDRTI